MKSQRHLGARVGKALLVIIPTSACPLRKRKPLEEGSEQRRLGLTVVVTGSFWLLCCLETEVGRGQKHFYPPPFRFFYFCSKFSGGGWLGLWGAGERGPSWGGGLGAGLLL